jgi:hypothetical protein
LAASIKTKQNKMAIELDSHRILFLILASILLGCNSTNTNKNNSDFYKAKIKKAFESWAKSKIKEG